jgi:murein DD-endopeptidase MepM/ murein hydrolase activator NlpD
LKSVITQKVQSVPSPAAHGTTLDPQVAIARLDVKEGSVQQLSLNSDHFATPPNNCQQPASKLAANLVMSVGTCSLILSPFSGSAIATDDGFSGGKVMQITSSDSKEDVYMQQVRQDASSLRTKQQAAPQSQLVTQKITNFRRINRYNLQSVPSAGYSAPISKYAAPLPAPTAVAIPVPAPRSFQIPTAVRQPVATRQPVQVRRFATSTYSPAQTTAAPYGGASQSTPPMAGNIWPAKGTFTSGFGRRWGRMHKGIDIAAATGTPIVAAADGVVVRSSWDSGGYGKRVDIQHADGSKTLYGHNSRLLVAVGQQVRQGQQISAMGSTGRSTGPHLHFEYHVPGGLAVNPVPVLTASRS